MPRVLRWVDKYLFRHASQDLVDPLLSFSWEIFRSRMGVTLGVDDPVYPPSFFFNQGLYSLFVDPSFVRNFEDRRWL